MADLAAGITTLLDWLSGPSWQHLVTALVHSLWQGAAAAVGLWFVLRAVPARNAQARYLMSLAALAAVVLGCLVTWSVLDYRTTALAGPRETATNETKRSQGRQAEASLARPGNPDENAADTTGDFSYDADAPPRSPAIDRRLYTAGVLTWLSGVLLMLARMAWLVTGARRLTQGNELIDGRLHLLLASLRERLGIRRAIRLIDGGEFGPAVLGVVRPVVLLPAAMILGMPTESAEAILAHELAHIRRHDYLVNLVQMLVEAALFFNPAVWWINRQIRQEREACCDRCAVALSGGTVTYAQTLADWTERQHLGQILAAAAALPAHRGGVVADRIKRLLVANYRPEMRVSWTALLVSTCLSFVAVLGLWRGTQVGVALAAEILSPRERLAVLDAERDRVRPVISAGAEQAMLSGTITTSDGRALPAELYADLRSVHEQGSDQKSLNLATPAFSQKFRPGVVSLAIHAPGYAPAVVGPLQLRPGDAKSGIQIVLDPGFAARFKLVNDQGQPVADGKASLFLTELQGGMNAPIKSDEGGTITVEHASRDLVDVTIKASGYQTWSRKKLTLEPDKDIVVQMSRATPTVGVVVDENGRTIAGATVRSALQVGPGNAGEKNGDSGPVLATTDEAGRFTLDSLDDGSQYAFLVEAQEHGRRLFPHIYAGAENLRFEVGPDFIVRGRIMGDLASLRHDAGRPIVESNQQPSIQVASDFSYGLLFTNRSPVDVIDGEGRFELKNLLPGQLSVTAAKRTVTVNLETPVTELTIDLTGKPPVPQMRPVVLRFVGPDPTLAPTGQLEVNIGDHAKIGAPINKRVNIEDGAVRLDAYADGYVNYAARNIVGYWFADGMVTVTPGDGPLEQDVEIVPAGAVRGRVLNANGSPASNGVHVGTKIRYHFSPQRWTTTGINNVPVDVQGNFFLSPLPFGADGDYVIVASRGHEQAVSAPVRVDEQHISPQVEIRFSPTASASGVVVGTDGAPRGGVEVKLWFRNGIADTIYSPGTQTNAEGRFTFEGLSTGVGDYWATLDGASRPPRIEVKLNPGGAPVRLIVPDERAQK